MTELGDEEAPLTVCHGTVNWLRSLLGRVPVAVWEEGVVVGVWVHQPEEASLLDSGLKSLARGFKGLLAMKQCVMIRRDKV
jgi:hypothetical protein